MKLFSHAPHFAALLLSLFAASHARADWLSSLTYGVGVSSSPSGPFGPTANLWTQSVSSPGATPSTIDLAAVSGPGGFILNGTAYLPIGNLTEYAPGPGGAPWVFPPQLTLSFQVTPQGKKSLVFSNQFTILANGTIDFANGGSIGVTVGLRTYQFTLETIKDPSPAIKPPGGPDTFFVGYEIFAAVPLNELAKAPEPSALVLAGLGAIALLGVSRRRRRLQAI
jgi:hypothetical protein